MNVIYNGKVTALDYVFVLIKLIANPNRNPDRNHGKYIEVPLHIFFLKNHIN